MATEATKQPVQLQLNNSGSWKKVATWDAGDDEASRMAHEAVALLGAINPSFTWRIATEEGYPAVLKRWDANTGWSKA